MSYSYVKIGGNGEKYDQMAEPVHDQLYFAGEVVVDKFIFLANLQNFSVHHDFIPRQ